MQSHQKLFTSVFAAILAAALSVSLFACAPPAESAAPETTASESASSETAVSENAAAPADWSFQDALGRSVTIKAAPSRVAALYGSFAEAWTLAGGTLAGTTEDAVSERGMELPDTVEIVGTTMEPNLESVLALDPDFVILSSEVSAQAGLDETLTAAGIPHAYFSCKEYTEYLDMMKGFTTLTGRPDLYEQNAGRVGRQIEEILAKVPEEKAPTVLLLRAYSTGVKAKNDDNVAGAMLRDLGADNIASRHSELLEDLSLESIVAEDPDFIFVTTMGEDTQKALDTLQETFEANPAWAGLSAVQNDRVVVLEKDLFHYKPNARWGESYEKLAEILYPDVFAS